MDDLTLQIGAKLEMLGVDQLKTTLGDLEEDAQGFYRALFEMPTEVQQRFSQSMQGFAQAAGSSLDTAIRSITNQQEALRLATLGQTYKPTATPIDLFGGPPVPPPPAPSAPTVAGVAGAAPEPPLPEIPPPPAPTTAPTAPPPELPQQPPAPQEPPPDPQPQQSPLPTTAPTAPPAVLLPREQIAEALAAKDIAAARRIFSAMPRGEEASAVDQQEYQKANALFAEYYAQQKKQQAENAPPPPLPENEVSKVQTRLNNARHQTAMGHFGQAEAQIRGAEDLIEHLRRTQANTEALEELTKAVDAQRTATEEARTAANPQQSNMQGFMDSAQGYLMQKGLAPLGELGGLIARFNQFLGNFAVLGGVAAGAGLIVGMAGQAERQAQEGRNEARAFLELDRSMGNDRGSWYDFLGNADNDRSTNALQTRKELADLNYSAREAGDFAASYGMPASGDKLAADTISGLRLARFTGSDEGQVARSLQAGVRSGVIDPGSADVLVSVLFKAVREGTKEGVSSAETFGNLQKYLDANAARGTQSDIGSMANYAAMLERLAESGSKGLAGGAGGNALEGVLGGMANPNNQGYKAIALRRFMQADLSAEDLGLEGAEAEGYKRLRQQSAYMAAEVAMGRIAQGNKAATSVGLQALDDASGGRPDMQYVLAQQMFGLSNQQILAFLGSGGFGQLGNTDPNRYQGQTPTDIKVQGKERELADVQYRKEFVEAETDRLTSLRNANSEMVNLTRAMRELRLDMEKFVVNVFGFAGGMTNPPQPLPGLGGTPLNPAPSGAGSNTAPAPTWGPLPPIAPPAPTPSTAPSGGGLGSSLGATAVTMRPGERYDANTLAAIRQQNGGMTPTWAQQGHDGVDYRIGRQGQTDRVQNPFGDDVRVISVSNGQNGTQDVRLRLANGDEVTLRHLLTSLKPGQELKANELLGMEGNAGSGYHLHFEPETAKGKTINARSEKEVLAWMQRNRFSGFAEGGYTGSGDPSEVAGVVHKDEFVIKAAEAAKHRPTLEAINAGQAPSATVTVRFEGLAGVQVSGHEQAPRLEALLHGSLQQWASEIANPHNEGRRRGR